MRESRVAPRASLSLLERVALEELDHTNAELSRLERLLIAAIVEIGRIDKSNKPPPVRLPRFDGLTARERDVLQLIADGHSDKSAGLILGISDRTVEIHRLRIHRKLGVRNSAELVRLVTEATLMADSPELAIAS